MYFLDSDLRGPLADYTFDYRRQPADKQPPSPEEPVRTKPSNRVARVLGAIAPRIFGKMRMEGQAQ
jgi:hypothetical protein